MYLLSETYIIHINGKQNKLISPMIEGDVRGPARRPTSGRGAGCGGDGETV